MRNVNVIVTWRVVCCDNLKAYALLLDFEERVMTTSDGKARDPTFGSNAKTPRPFFPKPLVTTKKTLLSPDASSVVGVARPTSVGV